MQLDFSPPQVEETAFGPRRIQYATPTDEFWRAWRGAESQLKDLGISVFKTPAGDFMIKRSLLPEDDDPAPETAAYEIRNKTLLRTYQVPHVGHLCAAIWRYRAALDASDTGTGKTWSALATAREFGLKVGIVCLKGGIAKWESVCDLFRIRPLFIANWEAVKTPSFPFTRTLKRERPVMLPLTEITFGEPLRFANSKKLVKDPFGRIVYQAVRLNGEALLVVKANEEEAVEIKVKGNRVERRMRASVARLEWTLDKEGTFLIFDEAHKAKGEHTGNEKLLEAAKPYRTLMLSATLAHSPRQMKAAGYLLGLHRKDNFREWSMQLGCFQGEHKEWDCVDARGAMLALSKEIFPIRGSRLRIADLGDQFPESQITADLYEIEHAKEQNEAFQKLLLEVETLKARGRDYKAKALVLQLRYRQLSELLKVDLLTGLAQNYVENGLSVVLFANFDETLDTLAKKLGTDCIIRGGQSKDERERHRLDFQHGRKRIILANLEAGGTSIDLHDEFGNFPRVSLIPPTFNPITILQALGRVWREGAKSKSLQRLVYAKGTVEEEICPKVAVKVESIRALNDGLISEADIVEPDIFKALAA